MTVLKGKQKRAGRGAINSSIRPKDTVGLQLQGWGWGQVKRVSDSLKNRLGYFHLKKYTQVGCTLSRHLLGLKEMFTLSKGGNLPNCPWWMKCRMTGA